ncbi:MAG: lipid-A-disaccharide synthase [Planctomycetota bacterium]|jgi:lipid-A-disaccharide synthase
MPKTKNKFRVFLSAAEPSGDVHSAGLITALQSRSRDIEFVGVGGPKMAEAGCELLENTVDKAAMLYNAFTQVARFYKLVKRIRRYLASHEVDLVIVCDSPSFNFHVAKAAKKEGVQTIFFVAPQIWAWGGWRIRKLRKRCDTLCCILPFEQDWFGSRGVEAVFVGNPLLDELTIDLAHHEKYSGFEPGKTTFAFMPGSRPAEIHSLWVPMQQIALRLKEKYSQATFVTVAVDAKRVQLLKETQIPGFECQYSVDSVNNTAGSVDFSIVASGSATLEVAAAGCPMVIMYQSSRILWKLIGWWLVRTKYLSLVNILAAKELVPEFMPYFTSIDPIVASIDQLLQDADGLRELSRKLTKLTHPLAEKKACKETAEIALRKLRAEN